MAKDNNGPFSVVAGMRGVFSPLFLVGAIGVTAVSGVLGLGVRGYSLHDVITRTNLSNFRDANRYGRYSVHNFSEVTKGVVDGARAVAAGEPKKITHPEPLNLNPVPPDVQDSIMSLFDDATNIFRQPAPVPKDEPLSEGPVLTPLR